MNLPLQRPAVNDTESFDWAGRLEWSLLLVVDAGLAALLFVVPYWMGGRHPAGHLLLVVLGVAVGTAWGLRLCVARQAGWHFTWAESIFFAGFALVLLQLARLPAATLAQLSPQSGQILFMWTAATDGPIGLGRWSQLTFTPAATRDALAVYMAYGIIFLVAVQRIHAIADVERFLRWTAWAAGLMATFGLIQYLFGNGKFFWFYESPFTVADDVVKGSFTNRNHFAQFLAMGIGPSLWWLREQFGAPAASRVPGAIHSDRNCGGQMLRRYLAAYIVGIVIFAGLMSLSRAGAMVMLLACAVFVFVLWRAALLTRTFATRLAGVAILVVVLLTVHGFHEVRSRLDDFRGGSFEQFDHGRARRRIWAANLRAIPAFLPVGSGIGSHADVYPMYFEGPQDCVYTHAESSYLQLTLEAGATGILLAIGAIGLCVYWCVSVARLASSARTQAGLAAIAAAFAANLTHAAVDFVWYVPGCMIVVLLLAASAAGLSKLSRQDFPRPARLIVAPRLACVVGTCCLLVLGVPLIRDQIGPAVSQQHWDRFLVIARNDTSSRETHRSRATDVELGQPIDADEPTELYFEQLEKRLQYNPHDYLAHERMASICILRFESLQQNSDCPLSIDELRNAAFASEFTNPKDLDAWLDRVLEDRRQLLNKALWHSRQALVECPLRGGCYLHLAKLSFLAHGTPADKDALLAQALRVAPNEGDVLFAAGREALMAGDTDQAALYWRRCFHSSPTYQQRLTDLFVGRFSAEFYCTMFQPDLAALRLLYHRNREVAPPQENLVFLSHYAGVVEEEAKKCQGAAAVRLWMELHGLQMELGDYPSAQASVAQALQDEPNNYDARLKLGKCLLSQKKFDQAYEQLHWCMLRQPHDATLQRLSATAEQGRLAYQPRKELLP